MYRSPYLTPGAIRPLMSCCPYHTSTTAPDSAVSSTFGKPNTWRPKSKRSTGHRMPSAPASSARSVASPSSVATSMSAPVACAWVRGSWTCCRSSSGSSRIGGTIGKMPDVGHLRHADQRGWAQVALDRVWRLAWDEDCPRMLAVRDSPGWLPVAVIVIDIGPARLIESRIEHLVRADPPVDQSCGSVPRAGGSESPLLVGPDVDDLRGRGHLEFRPEPGSFADGVPVSPVRRSVRGRRLRAVAVGPDGHHVAADPRLSGTDLVRVVALPPRVRACWSTTNESAVDPSPRHTDGCGDRESRGRRLARQV